MPRFTIIADFVDRLWRTDRVLTATGLAMLTVLGLTVAGLWLDPRLITGAPAWLKPAKFALSTAIYLFTLAWLFRWLPDWTRTRRIVGRGTAAIFAGEVAIIAFQAWRGETSHFNISTPFNAVLFGVMGTAIFIQTGGALAVAVALWKQRFTDVAFGWALRLGLAISIAGSATGGLMTRPTADQIDAVRAGHVMTIAGAHTVGAADGGPGLPGTGWSRTHGDLRVPHFVGLHALQALPLLVLFMRRRLAREQLLQATFAAAGLYAGLFAILLAQALRGESLVQPGTVTGGLALLWTVAFVLTLFVLRARQPRPYRASVSI